MSSHREAPEISKDPVADSTDVYAFVSPDKPDTVTLIANYIPLQGPAGGPNFYEFGDDVLYEIHVDNNGDGRPTSPTSSGSTPSCATPDTFLYNTGPILSLDSPNWNRRQFYSVTRISARAQRGPRQRPGLPAVQHRPAVHPELRRAWPNAAVHDLRRRDQGLRRPAGRRLLRRPRLDLRPRRPAAVRAAARAVRDERVLRPRAGVNATAELNVHSIAIQVPISQLRATASTAKVTDPAIGDRRVDDGQPPAGQRVGRRRRRETSTRPVPCRSRGWATRCSTRC